MSIEFTCPNCGTVFVATDTSAGKLGTCKKCGERVRVPEQSDNMTAPPVYPKSSNPALKDIERVPAYNALRLGGGVVSGLGWALVAFGVVVLLLALRQTTQSLPFAVAAAMALFVNGAVLIVLGQAFVAVRDVARNSWRSADAVQKLANRG